MHRARPLSALYPKLAKTYTVSRAYLNDPPVRIVTSQAAIQNVRLPRVKMAHALIQRSGRGGLS